MRPDDYRARHHAGSTWGREVALTVGAVVVVSWSLLAAGACVWGGQTLGMGAGFVLGGLWGLMTKGVE